MTLSLNGCQDVMINDRATQPSSSGQVEKETPAPQVSAEFRPVIAQLASEGLRLKEALGADLEAGTHHLAAIFQNTKKKEAFQEYEFRIIESDGRAAKTIYRRAEFFYSFDLDDAEANKLNGTDINGDGIKEIIVQSSSGGNCWSCNPTEIYQVKNHKAELIAAGPVQKIVDLNKDGVQELVITDARWEAYDDFSHASAPGAFIIYTWRNGKYVYASRDFPDYYKTEIERLRKEIEQAKADITADELSDESYTGLAVSLAITYAHAGDVERGLKELETLLNSNVKSPAQAKHRAEILEDFRKGESNAKLREMKPGDPMPLG